MKFSFVEKEKQKIKFGVQNNVILSRAKINILQLEKLLDIIELIAKFETKIVDWFV